MHERVRSRASNGDRTAMFEQSCCIQGLATWGLMVALSTADSQVTAVPVTEAGSSLGDTQFADRKGGPQIG